MIFHWLARDAGGRKAVEFVVLVHDPGHHLGRGSHVGGWDVNVWADEVMQVIDEPPGDPLKLSGGERCRVDCDAPLRPTVGNIDHGRFPGHQRRQGSDLVEIDLRMVPQPSLHRAAGVVVLHPVADECGHLSGVELDRNLHLHLPLRGEQQAANVF